jgi:hypothetical protein
MNWKWEQLITTSKGIIFSMDALVAFIIILFLILGFSISLQQNTEKLYSESESFFLEEKTIMITSAMLSNYNEENTMLGACIIDYEKKRTLTNELSYTNISVAKTFQQDNFFVKSISFSSQSKNWKFIIQNKKGKCITVKRFVLMDGEKGIINVEGCLDE